MKNIFKISLFLLLLNFLSIQLFGQYKSIETLAQLYVENNKTEIKNFVKDIKVETRIMILPFLNESKQLDNFSDAIAREIAAQLQLACSSNTNVLFIVKDEYSHVGMADLSDLVIYPDDPVYWTTLPGQSDLNFKNDFPVFLV